MESNKLIIGLRSTSQRGGGIAHVARLIERHFRNTPQNQSTPIVSAYGAEWPAGISRRLRDAEFLTRMAFLSRNYGFALFDELGTSRALEWRAKSIKLASFIHGIEVWEQAAQNRRNSIRKLDLAISNSHYTTARAAACGIAANRSLVCHLGSLADQAPPPRFNISDHPTAVIVGRMKSGRDKGHRAVLGVWPEILKRIPNARLIIVGEGDDQQSIEYLIPSGEKGRSVIMTGFVSEEERDRILAEAWLFAMPSKGEGFGLVYIEAMRQGIPVLASTYDAASEINVDRISGINVESDDQSKLADAICAFLGDRQLSIDTGLRAQKIWSERYTFTHFSTRFGKIIDTWMNQDMSRPSQ